MRLLEFININTRLDMQNINNATASSFFVVVVVFEIYYQVEVFG